jgi:hypothetical protein
VHRIDINVDQILYATRKTDRAKVYANMEQEGILLQAMLPQRAQVVILKRIVGCRKK